MRPLVIVLTSLPTLLAVACAVEGPAGPPIDDSKYDTPSPDPGDDGFDDPGGGDTTSSGGETPKECPYDGPPPIDPATLEPCPTCDAGGAHCVPNGLVPVEFQSQLGDCDGDSKCVPDTFIETEGLFIPPTCSSVNGAEGRCLSRCLPDVAAQGDALPQDICDASEACVPCYDPLSAQPTGACTLSCDPGPGEPPAALPKCCDDRGTCVPAEAAGDKADYLGEDVCPQESGEMLCAPDVFINDPGYQPLPCETELIGSLFGDDYKPGVCLPDCLPDVDSLLIGQDGCPDGFACAPCKKPPFGEDSGACDL